MTHTSRKRQFYNLAVLTGLSGMLVASSPQTVRANDNGQPRLVGAWAVQVTVRNCATNAPIGAAFVSLVSFHRGGTLSESSGSPAHVPGQRSEGHGAWQQLRAHTFSQQVIGLIRFDSAPNLPGTPTFDPTRPVSPGFSSGWQTISHRIRLTGPDRFKSSGITEFFDSNGQSYRTGCSTAVGERFE
jgi:hypothetical protein